MSPDKERLTTEGEEEEGDEVEGGIGGGGGGGAAVAVEAMEWRGCFGAGERWPFGERSRGLRGTARTGE